MAEAEVRAAFAKRLGATVVIGPAESIYTNGLVVGTVDRLGIVFDSHPIPVDAVLLGKWVDEQGILNIHHVPIQKMVNVFGVLFIGIPPTVAAFKAACDSAPGCRGYCRYADKFLREGILS